MRIRTILTAASLLLLSAFFVWLAVGCITIHKIEVFPNVRTDLRSDLRSDLRWPTSQPVE